MCRTFVLANQKVGVSKTSSVRNLSFPLAELGKKVLAVDLDPQCNLTVCFGLAPKKMKHTSGTLITRMLTEEDLPDKDEYIQTVGKVDVIPASRALTIAEVNMLILISQYFSVQFFVEQQNIQLKIKIMLLFCDKVRRGKSLSLVVVRCHIAKTSVYSHMVISIDIVKPF